jgi:WD40 repeat protein
MIASAGEDKSIQIWDIRVVHSSVKEIDCQSIANRLTFSPNGGMIAAPHDDGSVAVYTVDGEVANVFEGPESSDYGKYPATSVCWSRDERTICSSNWGRTIHVWKPLPAINI